MKVLPDGKIAVGADASGSVIALRFLETGTLDAAFTSTPVSLGTNAQATALALQADGKLLITANAQRAGFSDSEGYVLRFQSTGALDSSFANAGRFLFGGASDQTANAVAILPDGKSIHVGTSSGVDFHVTRLTAAGVLDTSFRTTGRTTVSGAGAGSFEQARAVTIDPLGNILVVGQSQPGSGTDVLLARLTADGILDTSFSGDGILFTHFGGGSNIPTGVVTAADGRILVSGHRPSGGATNFGLRRFHWNGDDDMSFGSGGLTTTSVGSAASDTAGLLIQPDRRIVVAGSASDGGFLRGLAAVRFEPGPELVNPEIAISQDLTSQTVSIGAPVTFSISAASEGPILYTWYRNNVIIARGSSSFAIASAQLSNEGTFKVEMRYGPTVKWSAEATLKVLAPPAILVHPNDQVVLAGQYVSFHTRYSGRAPFLIQWFKGDTEVTSFSTSYSDAYLNIWGATAADAASYHAVVSNADGSAEGSAGTLTLVADPSVEFGGPGEILEVNYETSLTCGAHSSVDYRVQWNKNGKAITNARDLSYNIGPVTLAHAGVYTVAIRSVKGSSVSPPFKVAVYNPAPATHTAGLQKGFELALQVAGPELNFAWFKGSEPLTADARITGTDSPTLKFKTIEPSDAGVYRCRVSGYGRTVDSGDQTLEIATAAPLLGALTLPPARIGCRYFHTLPRPALTSHFELAGLPAGLTYSKETQEIVGQATKPGTYPVKIVAVNPMGKSAAESVPLVVEPLPADRTGRFYGLMSDGNGIEGLFDLTIASTGSYSGKIQLCNLNGAVHRASFKGALAVDNGSADNPLPAELLTTTPVVVAGVHPQIDGPATLALTIYPDNIQGSVEVPLFDSTNGYSTWTVALGAVRCPWTAKQPMPPAAQGVFHVGLGSGSSAGPLGYSFGKTTITAAGIAAFSGKLSDGTSLTSAMPVDVANAITGMSFLYSNRGLTRFHFYINPGTTGPDYYDAHIAGNMGWRKSANLTNLASYPLGFEVDLSMVAGGKYLPPNLPVLTGPLVMNLIDMPSNLHVDIFDYSFQATIGRNHAATFGKTVEENPFRFRSLTFNPSVGTFSATSAFQYEETRYDKDGYPYEVTVKSPFTVQGMIIREPGYLSSIAVGFTLLNQRISMEDPPRTGTTRVSYPVVLRSAY